MGRKRNIFQKVIYGILLYPTFVREDRMFPRFLNKYLNQQDKVYGTEESFKKSKLILIFIVRVVIKYGTLDGMVVY